MDTEQRLTQAFLEAHPQDAALHLESRPAAEVVSVLGGLSTELAAGLLRRMALASAAECLARLPDGQAGEILSALPIDTAAGLLRLLGSEDQARLLGSAQEEVSAELALLLRYPEETAGAWMDPGVLALPGDVRVSEAQTQVRRLARRVRYYLYVVDRAHRLIGVLSLRQLMLAPGKEILSSLMREHVASLSVNADRTVVLAHPGWREFHVLPVVNEERVLVGVLRYETLRRLEEKLTPDVAPQSAVAVALMLGELYWISISQLLQAFWRPPVEGAEEGKGRRNGG